MMVVVLKFSREFSAYHHPLHWFARSKPFNSLENLQFCFMQYISKALAVYGFGSSSAMTKSAEICLVLFDNLLTTSDNLRQVANPLHIGVLTTLQPFSEQIPCKQKADDH